MIGVISITTNLYDFSESIVIMPRLHLHRSFSPPSEPPGEIMSFGVSPVNYSDSDSDRTIFRSAIFPTILDIGSDL